MLQVAEDCRIVLYSLEAPKKNIVRSKFDATVKLAETKLVSSMTAVVEELIDMNRSMTNILESSDSLKPMVSTDLDVDSLDLDKYKKLYVEQGNSRDCQLLYISFNKARALRGLAEKFFKEAGDLFDSVGGKSICPTALSKVNSCKQSLQGMTTQAAEKAIANLTCLTSLFRTLQTGETRNLLVNKALKGFTNMKLKPSKAFLQVLSKHATPDLDNAFRKMYEAEK